MVQQSEPWDRGVGFLLTISCRVIETAGVPWAVDGLRSFPFFAHIAASKRSAARFQSTSPITSGLPASHTPC